MTMISIGFQPDLIGVMSQFSQFHETLKKHIANATEKSAGRIGDQMITFMDWFFINPTGALAESVSVEMQSEYMAYVGPTLPYAWRRDRGFSGMTDSLGRFYPLDPGIFYAELTLDDSGTLFDVAQNYIDEIYKAWEECIGNLPQGTNAIMTEL